MLVLTHIITDIAYLCVFSITTYTHILPDLHFSKLRSKTIQLIFIRYFGTESYKLLDQKTSIVYSGQNMDFDERPTNLIVEL